MTAKRLLLLAALLMASGADGQTFNGRVVRVVDGDTFDLLTPEKNRWRVRLAEIDAPEMSQPYGKVSRQALAGLVLRQPVSFRLTALDKRGRMVGRTTIGAGSSAVDVSAVLVQRGAAWAYLDYLTDQRFLMWERAARQRKLGLWALPAAQQMAPWDKRHGSPPIRQSNPVPQPVAALPLVGGTAKCGTKRYCTQMTSCAEATFFLRQCGVAGLDGNHDGKPCEALCGAGQ